MPGEGVSSSSKTFNDENTIRDIIYSQIPQEEINKAKEVINSQGYSDLELKTRKTRLVIEFKRIQESGGDSHKGCSQPDAYTSLRRNYRKHKTDKSSDDNMYRKEKSHCVQSHGVRKDYRR